jgi:hypothetical protein
MAVERKNPSWKIVGPGPKPRGQYMYLYFQSMGPLTKLRDVIDRGQLQPLLNNPTTGKTGKKGTIRYLGRVITRRDRFQPNAAPHALGPVAGKLQGDYAVYEVRYADYPADQEPSLRFAVPMWTTDNPEPEPEPLQVGGLLAGFL